MSTDEVGASNDEVSLDAAMGGGEQDQEEDTTHVPEADKVSYEEIVKRAAEFVRDGVCDIDQTRPEEYHDVTEDEFRKDVAKKVNELTGREEQSDDADDVQTSDPSHMDWGEFWDEFGFGKTASKTQLKLAVAVSDQTTFSHNADQSPATATFVEKAARQGGLVSIPVNTSNGTNHKLKYALQEGA